MKLKLTGLESFTSPLIGNVILNKGQSVNVEDGIAEKLLEMKGHTLLDNVEYPYFKEVSAGDDAPEVALPGQPEVTQTVRTAIEPGTGGAGEKAEKTEKAEKVEEEAGKTTAARKTVQRKRG